MIVGDEYVAGNHGSVGTIPYPERLVRDESLKAACSALSDNLHLSARAAGVSRFLLTGARGTEAQCDTALGMALSLYRSTGDNVLLVDADFRQPQLHALLDLPKGPGLADVLAGKANASAAIRQVVGGLNVLTSGTSHLGAESLLGSLALSKQIEELAKRYKYLLFTSSSCLRYPDATLLAMTIKSVILFVEVGDDTAEEMKRCKARLMAAGADILGLATLLKQ